MNQKVIFGVDVGGTAIKFGIFDEEGTLHNDWELPTDKSGKGSHILEQIALSMESVIGKIGTHPRQIAGIGIGVPGPVLENGEVVEAANLGWYHRNVQKELEELSGLKVRVGNDANLAALGEMWAGSGKGCRNLVLLTLGTGVGGGIIQNGRLVFGSRGAGGEIGHMCVEPKETVVCNCGKRGCLEQYASATGIVRLAKTCLFQKDKSKEKTETAEAAETAGSNAGFTAKDVWDAVKAGDSAACRAAEIFGEKMGLAMANVAVILNPEKILLGGGMSKAGDILFDYIKKYYEKFVFSPCKQVEFGFASLGNQAGIYGAAKLVLGEEETV